MRVPLPRLPISAARRSPSPWSSNRDMPPQNPSKACCTLPPGSWRRRPRHSYRRWQWIKGWPPPTALPATMLPYLAALGRHCRQSSGPCDLDPTESAAQHLSLLRRICRAAPRAHRNSDRSAAQIARTESQLRQRADLPDGRSVVDRTAQRRSLDRRVIPPAISRLSRPRLRAALAVALDFSRLSRPGLSRFSKKSRAL